VKRRVVVTSVVVVLLLVGAFFFGFPFVNSRCHRWYHSVDFVADGLARERYGPNWIGLDEERVREIRHATWSEAIDEVGAKPFYCS